MTKLFLTIAKLEGISLILLLGLAMPMKYYFDQPNYVKHIGMAHGVLFIAYILLSIYLCFIQSWPVKKLVFVCVASVLPFGTFYIEHQYFRKKKNNLTASHIAKNN
jgi:integral membrane protein